MATENLESTRVNKLCSYVKRKKYAVLSRILPSVKEQRRLETMIGPLGYWKQIQKYQFEFLKSKGLKPHHTLLDIGCGPLSGGLAFIPYLQAGNYSGIDIREESIKEAHVQIAKAGLADKQPLVVASDNFGRDELGDRKYDFIWASQILYHFDNELMETFIEQMAGRMHADSIFYGDIIGYPNKVRSESQWQGFTFTLHTHEFLAEVGKRHGLSMKCIGQLSEHGYPGDIDLKTSEMLEFRKSNTSGIST
jgi:cyclopropane fatty-acyl-phospholipid synthase-like methyltransferase